MSSMSNGGGKVSFLLTFQLTSPRLTCQMMDSIHLRVDEIVTTCDAALTYSYIHLMRKARSEELERAIRTLASTHGVCGSLIFGYDTVNSNSMETFELIEDHPGFKMLVQHEADGNEHFHRWTANGYSGINCGYNLLKTRLLAKREQSAGGEGLGGSTGASAGGGRGIGGVADNEEEEEEPSPTDYHERSKRQRTGSSGGEREMVSVDAMTATLSTVIASAISSSGSAASSAFASKTHDLREEQRRREHAEQRVREMEMELERARIEAEVARKYEERLREKDAEREAAVMGVRMEYEELLKARDARHDAVLREKDEDRARAAAELAALEGKLRLTEQAWEKASADLQVALKARASELQEQRRLAADDRDALCAEVGRASALAAERWRELSAARFNWEREWRSLCAQAEKAEAMATGLRLELESAQAESGRLLDAEVLAHAATRVRYDALRLANDAKDAEIGALRDEVAALMDDLRQEMMAEAAVGGTAEQPGEGGVPPVDDEPVVDVLPLSDDEIEPAEEPGSRYKDNMQRKAWIIRHSGNGIRLRLSCFLETWIYRADECISMRDASGNYTTLVFMSSRIRYRTFNALLEKMDGLFEFKIVRVPCGKVIGDTRYYRALQEAVERGDPSVVKERSSLAPPTSVLCSSVYRGSALSQPSVGSINHQLDALSEEAAQQRQ